jgi:MFS family permease
VRRGRYSTAAATRGCADRAKPWVLAATILGSSMAFIDGSAVNVALPRIQSDLNVSVQGTQWVVNGYMLTLGALILVGGSTGDRFGRDAFSPWALLSSRPRPLAAGWRPTSQF